MTNFSYVFFGTSDFSVVVLEELIASGLPPKLVVTSLDKPQGRGLVLTPPKVKVVAQQHSIPVLQPAKLTEEVATEIRNFGAWDIFLVASYGKIVPTRILSIPTHGCLNIHPSLLPKYRGPSPIQSQILAGEEKIGVTLMLMDEEVDHGPLIASVPVTTSSEQPYLELEKRLATEGARLFASSVEPYLSGTLTPTPQDHSSATFTKKITKEDSLIDLHDDPRANYRKFLAFSTWPRTYFFIEHEGRRIRIIVTEATYTDGQFVINKVIPEGRKEISYKVFCSS